MVDMYVFGWMYEGFLWTELKGAPSIENKAPMESSGPAEEIQVYIMGPDRCQK